MGGCSDLGAFLFSPELFLGKVGFVSIPSVVLRVSKGGACSGFVFGIVQTRAPWPATCRGSSPPCASSTTGHMVMISLHFFVFLKNCVCIFASLLFVFVTTDMIWVFTVISYTNSNASSNWIYRKTISKMKLNLNMLWKASCDSYYLICHHISKVKYL